MLKKDYLERVIESFVQMVAYILGKTRAGEHDVARAALQDTAERYVGLSLKALDPLSFDSLRSLLRLGGPLDIQRCLMLADLRALEGRLFDTEGDSRSALRSYSTSIRLYVEAADEQGISILDDHRDLADAVAESLQLLGPPPETEEALERYMAAVDGDTTLD